MLVLAGGAAALAVLPACGPPTGSPPTGTIAAGNMSALAAGAFTIAADRSVTVDGSQIVSASIRTPVS